MSSLLATHHTAGLVHGLIERLNPNAPVQLCADYVQSLLDASSSSFTAKNTSTATAELRLASGRYGEDAGEAFRMLADLDSDLAEPLARLFLTLRESPPPTTAQHSQTPPDLLTIRGGAPPPPSSDISSSYRGKQDFVAALRGSEPTERSLLARWTNASTSLGGDDESKFILRAVEIGRVHRAIRHFASALTSPTGGGSSGGLVSLRLAHAVQDELSACDQFLVLLEKQSSGGGESLAQLLAWSLALERRLGLLWQVCDNAMGRRGGALVSAVYAVELNQGAFSNRSMVRRLRTKCFRPLLHMVRALCVEGKLVDQYGEMFVRRRKSGEGEFEVNARMLPSFISQQLATRICRLGNRARIASQLDCAVDVKGGGGDEEETAYLEHFVCQAEAQVDGKLRHALFEKHSLVSHLAALKDFLLLARGDFAQLLVDSLLREGTSSSSSSSSTARRTIKWQSHVDHALDNSTASELPSEVLSRVSVLHDETELDAVFCLDYVVDFPLSLVVQQQHKHQMDAYYAAFASLWRLKLVQQRLGAVWKARTTARRRLAKSTLTAGSGASQLLHKSDLVRAEMAHLVSTMHEYLMTDVVDASWAQLVCDLEAARTVDDFATAHSTFVHSVLVKGLIQEEEKEEGEEEEDSAAAAEAFAGATPSKSPVFALRNKLLRGGRDTAGLPLQLRGLLDLVTSFCNVHQRLLARLDLVEEDGEDHLSWMEQEFAPAVDTLSSKYWEALHVFLDTLRNVCKSESLRFLGWRLDINRFYG